MLQIDPLATSPVAANPAASRSALGPVGSWASKRFWLLGCGEAIEDFKQCCKCENVDGLVDHWSRKFMEMSGKSSEFHHRPLVTGDRRVQWWGSSCWKANWSVKHLDKSGWSLIWVLFATIERYNSQLLFVIHGKYPRHRIMERDLSSTRQWGSCETTWKTCSGWWISNIFQVPASLKMVCQWWSQFQSGYIWW